MKLLALITARGGSKRVPGKNSRLLGGVPLIAWSINATKGIAEICETLVTTDAEEIAAIARSFGALVPWLRPRELSTDTASSVDVCIHALDWYEDARGQVDGLLLLQPTSPFRSHESVRKGIGLFREYGREVVAFSPAKSHPSWCFELRDGRMHPFMSDGGLTRRSQDLPPAYVISGAFYLITPEVLRERRTFCDGDVVPLILDRPEETIDIDTEWDWMMADAALRWVNPETPL